MTKSLQSGVKDLFSGVTIGHVEFRIIILAKDEGPKAQLLNPRFQCHAPFGSIEEQYEVGSIEEEYEGILPYTDIAAIGEGLDVVYRLASFGHILY